jgi:hypothetical protein
MHSSSALAVFGSYRDIPVHILVDCNSETSSVSASFAMQNNIPRTITACPFTALAKTTCSGPVVVPSETGFFRLSFQMDIIHFSRGRGGDVVLGQYWLAMSWSRAVVL